MRYLKTRLLAGAPLRRRCASSTRSTPTGATGSATARMHATGRFPVAERLAEERQALRPLPPARFDWSGHRSTRVPIDGYLRHGRCFYRAPERLVHERVELRFDRDAGLDRAPRRGGRPLPAQLRARASGCRRRSCAPSRRRAPPRRRARRARGRAARARRLRGAVRVSEGEGRRAAALPARAS